jgi:hypothetical protein
MGGIVALDLGMQTADAQSDFKVTPAQPQINQKISQAAVRRANRNRTDIEALNKAVGTNGDATAATGRFRVRPMSVAPWGWLWCGANLFRFRPGKTGGARAGLHHPSDAGQHGRSNRSCTGC